MIWQMDIISQGSVLVSVFCLTRCNYKQCCLFAHLASGYHVRPGLSLPHVIRCHMSHLSHVITCHILQFHHMASHVTLLIITPYPNIRAAWAAAWSRPRPVRAPLYVCWPGGRRPSRDTRWHYLMFNAHVSHMIWCEYEWCWVPSIWRSLEKFQSPL